MAGCSVKLIRRLPVLTHGSMRCRDCGFPIRLGLGSSLTEHEDEQGRVYYASTHLPGDCEEQAAGIERELEKRRKTEERAAGKRAQGSLL